MWRQHLRLVLCFIALEVRRGHSNLYFDPAGNGSVAQLHFAGLMPDTTLLASDLTFWRNVFVDPGTLMLP